MWPFKKKSNSKVAPKLVVKSVEIHTFYVLIETKSGKTYYSIMQDTLRIANDKTSWYLFSIENTLEEYMALRSSPITIKLDTGETVIIRSQDIISIEYNLKEVNFVDFELKVEK